MKSFSKAARLAHLSQPAVSSQIQNLEKKLNTVLFHRTSTGVHLTETGKAAHYYIRKIVDLQVEMEKQIANLSEAEQMEFIIGGSSTAGNYILPELIWKFKEQHPKLQILLEVGNSREILIKLLDGKLDAAVVEGPITLKEHKWIVRHLLKEELVLISSCYGPFSSFSSILSKELLKVPLIFREDGSGVRKTFEKALAAKQVDISKLNIVAEMGSIDALKSAVEAGLGLTVTCRLAVQKELEQGVFKTIEIKDLLLFTSFHLVYQIGRQPNKITQLFANFLTPDDSL